jgi:CHASE3 domain sensor protein
MQLVSKVWSWGERIVAMLGGRTIAMLAAALLVAFGSVMFSDNWIVSFNKQVETIKQVRENIAVLHQLKANLYEAESAQRGYIITKRTEYVAPFENALTQARANIELSETLVKKTSTEQNQVIELQWLKQISASVEAKSAEMLLTIRLIEQNKIDEANQVVDLDIGRQQMQAFVIAADKLITQQTKDADEMIEKRRATLILVRASVIGGALILNNGSFKKTLIMK